jgi:redox-sensitive bicupin YhaK (pirin superfamily)
MFGNGPNPRNAEGWTNSNWLKSRFHFSFAEYSNGPSSFGCLRVMNDDLVQPNRGFGAHPHRDMEIMTFVVDGELTHKDSVGTQETLGRGSIQYMTAGTGIRHSEHNLHRTKPLRFIQSWVMPRSRGLNPKYGSMPGNEEAAAVRNNNWAQLVSDVETSTRTPVKINQDCNVFVTELDSGRDASALSLETSRQAYLLCVEGSVTLGDKKQLRQHDAAELKGPLSLEMTAGSEGALVLVFEMKQTNDTRG